MGIDLTISPSDRTVGSKYTGPIIDTDVHEAFTTLDDLVPYLGEPWRRLIVHRAWKGLGDPFAFWAAHGVDRGDIQVPDGVPPGSSYERFKELVLDLYPIRHAILTSFFWPGVMKTQFEFATALTTAYNNWVIEHWLERDPRLLTSIHVAPQDPHAAAREIDRLGDHPRVVQVLLPLGQWTYGDPFYHPIFEAAARHHLVIGFHHSTDVTSALGTGFTQSLLRVGSTMGFYFFPLLLAAVGLYPTLLLLAIVPFIGLVFTLIIKWDPVLQKINVDEEEETIPALEGIETGVA